MHVNTFVQWYIMCWTLTVPSRDSDLWYIINIISQIFLLNFKSCFPFKICQNFERRHPTRSLSISRKSFFSLLKKDWLRIPLFEGVWGMKASCWEKAKQWRRANKITATHSKGAGREGDQEQENPKGERRDCSEGGRRHVWISACEQGTLGKRFNPQQ